MDLPFRFPDNKTKIAGIILFHYPTMNILLLEKHNGKFDLPKGHVEPGETFLEGALRETFEETGLHHHKNFQVYPYHYISVPSRKWLRFYLGVTKEQKIKIAPEEHYDFHWVSPEQAIKTFGPDNQFSNIITAMKALVD